LLLAHHRNDQVETILLRLLRGSGSAGVAGMCEQRDVHGITLVRPLLNVTREMLLRLAQQQGLNWIDDESNEDITIARNYLRHRVLPVLEQRWPNCATTLSRSARLISGEHQVLMRLIGRDCKSAIDQRQSLDLEPWRKRPDDEQLLWLRYWLGCFSELLPSEAVLQQIHQQVSNAAMDAQVCVGWGQWQVRRFRNRLWCIPSLPTPASDWSLGVSAGKEQPLGAELGVVRWQSTPLAAQPGLRAELLDKPLEWRLRQGGEHFKPAGRPRRALKKWLQDLHLPPWWRDRLPLLYWHDQLLLVPGLGATEGYAADAESPGLWAVWQPPATS
jgi:tRNA(Ile)-lysidine synthase